MVVQLGDISNLAASLVVIYWVLSRFFPRIDISRLSKNNGTVSRQDWLLLFQRYDDLVKTAYDQFKTQIAQLSDMMERVLESVRSFQTTTDKSMHYIENVDTKLKETDNRLQKLAEHMGQSEKELNEKLNKILTDIQILKERKGK